MCLLLMKATVVLEMVQTASRQCSDVSRQRAHSRVRSDANTGKSLGSAFMPLEMHSPLFKKFCIRYLKWTNSIPVLCSCSDHNWGIVVLSAPRNVR